MKKKTVAKNIWSKKYPPAKNVEAFIKASPIEAQAKLGQLRKIIKACSPGAEELISYRMPVYKLNGRQLVGFAGYKNHVGFYPMSGTFLDGFKKGLKDYQTSKGAIRFPLSKPLPVALIKKLIKLRINEIGRMYED